MDTHAQTTELFSREQFRISSLQVFNWGTFSGRHDIPIAERGFLFVGRSGTGKSTLLDAFSALLIPARWIDFNAAAREAEKSGRDRNLLTYLRGAWAEQKDNASGEIATQYLRSGSTWSALALTYQNSLNQTVTLMQLFWIRGNSNSSADIKRLYLIIERAFDLRELENFGASDFDVRKLKTAMPDAFIRDEFRPYCERFCRLLGIESEMALRLLHKTQSAKNLGDLNLFLRDFMLDKPETFAAADRLVNEFGELNTAHQAVVTARKQIQVLAPARICYESMQSLQQQRNGLYELQTGVEYYREIRRIELLKQRITELTVHTHGLEAEIQSSQTKLDYQNTLLRDLEQQHRQIGGDRIEQWEADKKSLEGLRAECLRKRAQASSACEKLNWILPESPIAFAEIIGKATQELQQWKQHSDTSREQQFQLAGQKVETEKEFTNTVKEVQALKRQPSNIPAEMLELRKEIATAIGITENSLPFVGELIEVKSDEISWQGAIERLLHGFALSLLVDEKNYSSLSNHLNATNLGRRIVYYRTNQVNSWQAKPIDPASLIFKVNVKPGQYTEWMQAELKQRFDYLCVDSLQAFRSAERALTREGQIKHNKTRHEKDDRYRVDDRRYWVLGFDNREKLSVFERQAQKLADTIAQLNHKIQILVEKDNNQADRAMHCQTLVNINWQEIDVAPLLERISYIDEKLIAVREGNVALKEINQKILKQKKQVDEADQDLRNKKVEHTTSVATFNRYQEKLTQLQQDPSIILLTPYQKQQLDDRFANFKKPVNLENLDSLTTSVLQAIVKELEDINRDIHKNERIVESSFADFKRSWPMDAGDVDTSLASAQDYFAKLTRLETDGLPAYEHRFFELLQSQSHQNMADLSSRLNQARKAILERMDLVNESLGQAPFNPGTHLRIEVKDRQLVEIKEFKQTIQEILAYALGDDRALAEARFTTLQELVNRLGSQDSEQKRWRECVLDVRQHVEFIAREIDTKGFEVEVYRSGAGKSGGQRQKLATTCLAAALRYQLGGHHLSVPMYAPVILDEAFDKADNEFTTLAMNIFTNFGFQMIVATPLRAVMTLEPFIGGACFVDISDRRHSAILLIEYDREHQCLRLPKIVDEEANLEIT
ncbi:MAG: ATP-binding protein [Proteobacteria bacterium]|nr:ATP-binding protein [Pseudomonadota bacterium]